MIISIVKGKCRDISSVSQRVEGVQNSMTSRNCFFLGFAFAKSLIRSLISIYNMSFRDILSPRKTINFLIIVHLFVVA